MSDDTKQLSSEEVKAKVIEEFGLDEETHSEFIEKLTNKQLEHQKELSKAIDKKAAYRQIGVEAGILDPKTFEPIKKEPDGDINKPKGEALDVDTVLTLQANGFDAKAIKAIKDEATNLGIPVSKLAENETWVSGFKSKMEVENGKNNFTDATPNPSGKIVLSGGKTYEQVVSSPDASPEEKQAAFDAANQAIFRRRDNR